MILEEITLRNWRGYRDSHTFRFKDNINLVVGRNEAGKSILFEALTRALFDRHKSKAEEICEMQPLCSSLGPEVTATFRAGGVRFKVFKRFLQDPRSELYSERNGRWELNEEGDASDNRLREILSGEGTSRTAARPEHRGIAQALWYLQTDKSIPEGEWSSGVKKGLQGLVDIAAVTPRERTILKRLEESYKEFWTPTGRVSSTSELGRLLAEIPMLEEEVLKLREKAMTIERYRGDLEELQNQEYEKKTELQKAEKDFVIIDEQVRACEALMQEKESMERARDEVSKKAQLLQEELEDIQDRQSKSAQIRIEIQQLEESFTEAQVEAKQNALESDGHARRWKEELEPILREVETQLRTLSALSNLEKLKKNESRLENHKQKIEKLTQQLEDARKERASMIAPDTKERKRFSKIEAGLSYLEAQIEASAVRVSFEWHGKSRKVTTTPHLTPSSEGEYIVTEPTEFLVQSMGKLRIRSGAKSLEDLLTEKSKAQQNRESILRQYGVEDAEHLARLQEIAHEMDLSIGKLEEQLKEAEGEEPNVERELAQVKISIQQEKIIAEQISSPIELEESSVGEIISAKERDKKRLIGEIESEQRKEREARERQLKHLKEREDSSIALADRKAQARGHDGAVAKALEKYGTLDQLKRLVNGLKEELANIKASLATFMEDYEERVETPQRLHEQMKTRIRELEEATSDLHIKLAETMARIEESAAQNNYSQLADAEIELQRKKRRATTLQTRADGVMLLRNLIRVRERERTTKLSSPIVDQVNRWLKMLTENSYDSLQMDESLRPVGVHIPGYSTELPMTSLSHGAQEQVVVLLRLGIGVLVSKDERNLIVIDDRLVNADPIRMKRLCLILQEVARTCQLVIASCNDTPYAGLGAYLVRVPTDGLCSEIHS